MAQYTMIPSIFRKKNVLCTNETKKREMAYKKNNEFNLIFVNSHVQRT